MERGKKAITSQRRGAAVRSKITRGKRQDVWAFHFVWRSLRERGKRAITSQRRGSAIRSKITRGKRSLLKITR